MKHKATWYIAAFAATIIACSVNAAQTLRVVSRTEDKIGVWADAYLDINDAIAAVTKGTEESHDTILVASGTYNIGSTITVVADKHWLEIRSANLETGEEDREGTILDGGGAIRIMDILSPAVMVSGFTFQNGYLESESYASNTGGAAIHADQHKVAVRNCIFRNNKTVNITGTCVCCLGREFNVSGCIFTNNTQAINISDKAVRGLAIYCRQHTVSVSDCLFDGNYATGEKVDGMLVSGEDGSAYSWNIDNCTVLTNAFTKTGATGKILKGLVRLYRSSEMRNCRFSCNGLSGDVVYGSVLAIDESCMLSNCVFTAINDSSTGGSDSTIYIAGCDSSFINCKFTDSVLGRNFIEMKTVTNTLFRNCLVANNTRSTSNHRIMRLNGCPVSGRGLVLENCTIANNDDAIHTIGSAGTSSCTNIYVNTVITGLLHPYPEATQAIARNCCFGAIHNNQTSKFQEFSDCIMISNIPDGDLRFVDAANGNYRLDRRSPLRDNGRILPWMTVDAVDLGGGLRVVSGTGDPLAVDPSALPDIGCYECALKPLGLSLIIR